MTARNPGYDEQRRVHNGLIDRRPLLIARCRSAADVAAAVRFAGEAGLPAAVRGGGHNVAGRATIDDGVLVDLSLMSTVDVDPERRVAVAGGGATWGGFNEATQKHGLATTVGAVSGTGVGGLTLGGGWVVAGIVAHPFDRAGEVLRYYRERAGSLPDELTLAAGVLHAPDGSGAKLVAILAGWCGDTDEGMDAVRPLKEFGEPVLDGLGPMPYVALNQMLDGGFPRGALNYWKSAFVRDFSDEAIDTLTRVFADCPAPMSGIPLRTLARRDAADPVVRDRVRTTIRLRPRSRPPTAPTSPGSGTSRRNTIRRASSA